MSGRKEEKRFWRVFFFVRRYLVYFFLISFVITCCMLLFLHTMKETAGLAPEEIERAAKVTFGNVILLALIGTVLDGIRRRFMVEWPAEQIVAAAEKIMRGDLSARVHPPQSPFHSFGDFDGVAAYFNKMAEELSSIETLRTDFIANVSHELKTPLAVIQNYGTMLQQPNLLQEKRQEYAKAVTEASRRLADLISNILKLNKLENQQIFPAGQVYDLGEQLCECLLSFEDIWERRGIEIDTDIQEEVYVKTDMELLSLVWNNLFSNAIKFTGPGGAVSLSLKAEGEFAVVKVKDTGCGIRPEAGAHIFEKFYQADTSHAAQGNGLGLALVKRVIDIVNGDISVESEVGKGSTFSVKLKAFERRP